MRKTFIFMAIFMALLAYAGSNRSRCSKICRKNVPSTIRCVRDGKVCRKMRHCTLLEVNCRRLVLNQRRLTPTSSYLCRNIKSSLGSGQCAAIRKPRSTRRSCNKIHCTESSKELSCYRSKRNNCRLLTSCQLARRNCRRSPNNKLRPTHPLACAGSKKARRRQKCRPFAKKG